MVGFKSKQAHKPATRTKLPTCIQELEVLDLTEGSSTPTSPSAAQAEADDVSQLSKKLDAITQENLNLESTLQNAFDKFANTEKQMLSEKDILLTRIAVLQTQLDEAKETIAKLQANPSNGNRSNGEAGKLQRELAQEKRRNGHLQRQLQVEKAENAKLSGQNQSGKTIPGVNDNEEEEEEEEEEDDDEEPIPTHIKREIKSEYGFEPNRPSRPRVSNKRKAVSAGLEPPVSNKRKAASAGLEPPTRRLAQTSQLPASKRQRQTSTSRGPVTPAARSVINDGKFIFLMISGYPTPSEILSYESTQMMDCLADLWNRIYDIVTNIWEHRKGEEWQDEFTKSGYDRTKISCVTSKFLHLKGDWKRGGEGRFACGHCVKHRRPCFTFKGAEQEFWLLPLHPEDRDKEVTKGNEIRYWIN